MSTNEKAEEQERRYRLLAVERYEEAIRNPERALEVRKWMLEEMPIRQPWWAGAVWSNLDLLANGREAGSPTPSELREYEVYEMRKRPNVERAAREFWNPHPEGGPAHREYRERFDAMLCGALGFAGAGSSLVLDEHVGSVVSSALGLALTADPDYRPPCEFMDTLKSLLRRLQGLQCVRDDPKIDATVRNLTKIIDYYSEE